MLQVGWGVTAALLLTYCLPSIFQQDSTARARCGLSPNPSSSLCFPQHCATLPACHQEGVCRADRGMMCLDNREAGWHYLGKWPSFHELFLKSEALLAGVAELCKSVALRMTTALSDFPFRKLHVVCDGGMRWEAAAAGAVFSQLCIWQLWLDTVQRKKAYAAIQGF